MCALARSLSDPVAAAQDAADAAGAPDAVDAPTALRLLTVPGAAS